MHRFVKFHTLAAAAVVLLAIPGPASALVCQPPTVRVCEYIGSKPRCYCESPGTGTPPVTGTFTPSFYITHVVYAPPGSSSSIAYSHDNSMGSNTSSSLTFRDDFSVKVTQKHDLIFASGSVSMGA